MSITCSSTLGPGRAARSVIRRDREVEMEIEVEAEVAVEVEVSSG